MKVSLSLVALGSCQSFLVSYAAPRNSCVSFESRSIFCAVTELLFGGADNDDTHNSLA
eukprot:Pgem_evm1s1152